MGAGGDEKIGLETVTYISDLNAANPDGATDLKSEGDNHIRNIKKGILNTFPNIAGEVTPDHVALNALTGVTDAAGGGSIIDVLASGTAMVFNQTAAPTGWTKQVTHNDKALRLVTGTAGDGGTDAFTATFSSSKATEDYTLLEADIPGHTHTGTTDADTVQVTIPTVDGDTGGVDSGFWHTATKNNKTDQSSNDSGSHTHTFTSGSTGGDGAHAHDITMDVQYVDVILATKD